MVRTDSSLDVERKISPYPFRPDSFTQDGETDLVLTGVADMGEDLATPRLGGASEKPDRARTMDPH